LKAIALKDFTERVQSAKKYKCAEGEPCADAIATCNGIDQALFDHYSAAFSARVQQVMGEGLMEGREGVGIRMHG
jgi:hypothetical protein